MAPTAPVGMDEDIRPEDFEVVFADNFAKYGLATIIDRAIPDARDGLKPVQRRILYGMLVNSYLHNRKYVKSAEVVGRIMGDFHPHGDTSIYDAAARLAQDWVMRYPLLDGQGNFGSIDDDPPAAPRYTEMRLLKLAEAHMADIREDTVPMIQTYKQDPKALEPLYLPGRLPPVCFPAQGIAVGNTTRIPPHNLGEVLRACMALIDKPHMTGKELLRYIPGPDFPTGGTILGTDGITEYLETGKGQLTLRAEARVEQTPRGARLVVVEVPYPDTMKPDKAKLVDAIRDAVNEGKVTGVADLRDESDQDHGTRIVLDLKPGEPPARVLSRLYRHTPLQVNVNVWMTFLFGEPNERARHARQTGMLEILRYWTAHQVEVLTRRTQYRLARAKERLHVVEGLIIGAAHADDIVRIFQNARDRVVAKEAIAKKYKLSDIQANVIANMTLAQVTKLDAAQYQQEAKELRTRIAELKALLADPLKMRALLKDEMQALIAEFGDARRTRIDREANKQTEVEEVADLVAARPILLSLSREGSFKALAPDAYRARKGSADAGGRDEGAYQLVPANTTDFVLFVTSLGRVCMVPARGFPESTRAQKGESVRRLIPLEPGEAVRALVPIADFVDDRYLVIFTRNGKVKKTALAEYRNANAAGLLDMKLLGDDDVVDAFVSDGKGEYLVVTSTGKALRFADDDVRAAGRVGQGVQAISLAKGGSVVAASALAPNDRRKVLLVASDGYGKRTRLSEFPTKGRATSGVDATKMARGAELACAVVVDDADEVLFVSAQGLVTRAQAREISTQGRPSRGMRLLTLTRTDDRVLTATVLAGGGNGNGNGNAKLSTMQPSLPLLETDGQTPRSGKARADGASRKVAPASKPRKSADRQVTTTGKGTGKTAHSSGKGSATGTAKGPQEARAAKPTKRASALPVKKAPGKAAPTKTTAAAKKAPSSKRSPRG